MLTAYLIETNNRILDNYVGVRDIKYVCFGFYIVSFVRLTELDLSIKFYSLMHFRANQLPVIQSDQLATPGAPSAYVELGVDGADAVLHRCVLRNCTYSLRIPSDRAPATAAGPESDREGRAIDGHSSTKPTLAYDAVQILADVEDEFLKNRARIDFRVRFLHYYYLVYV